MAEPHSNLPEDQERPFASSHLDKYVGPKPVSDKQSIGPDMTRWSVGVYVGVERRTGQYIVYDHRSETVHHARTSTGTHEMVYR